MTSLAKYFPSTYSVAYNFLLELQRFTYSQNEDLNNSSFGQLSLFLRLHDLGRNCIRNTKFMAAKELMLRNSRSLDHFGPNSQTLQPYYGHT